MSVYREKPRWTARQELFMKINFEKMTDEKIAEALGKSLKSIRRKRARMILPKAKGRGICKAAKVRSVEEIDTAAPQKN